MGHPKLLCCGWVGEHWGSRLEIGWGGTSLRGVVEHLHGKSEVAEWNLSKRGGIGYPCWDKCLVVTDA